MNKTKTTPVAIALLSIAAFAAVGCTAAESSDGPVTAPDQEITKVSCAQTIEKKVLDRALEISDTASIVSTKTLYGEDLSFADAVLVRVSDETEPSDYLVVRSKLKDGVTDKNQCTMKKVVLLAEGLLPDDGKLVSGDLGAKCNESIKAAVLKKALKASDTASITATKIIYGGGSTFGGAVLVRVSDEVEPTDYLATFSTSGSAQVKEGGCTVKMTELLNEGVLPKIPGL